MAWWRTVRGPTATPTTGTTGRWTSLLAAKAGRVVSLVVPARNEAATVGDVVTRVREALVDTVALLDEIVVIDSDSTDATYDVATDAGAVVHRAAEIRPDLGLGPGQGRGDVEVAVRHPGRGHRVHGRRPRSTGTPTSCPGCSGRCSPGPRSQLVKGFYERPMVQGETARAVRGRPRHRAGRAAADPAALPRARPGCTSRWRGSGRSGGRSSRRSTSRPGTPSSWPRWSTRSRAHGLDALAQVDLGTRAHRHQCAARPQRHGHPDPGGGARAGRRTDRGGGGPGAAPGGRAR